MRISALVFVFAVSLFLAGCSSAPTDSGNSASAGSVNSAAEMTDANAALVEGTRLLDRGDTDRAIEFLDRAVELDPDLADAYFQLGIAHSLIETRDAAIIGEQVTPTPSPSEPGQKKQRVAVTKSEKAFEKAVEAYKKRIDANGEDHLAHFNLGRAYNKLNEDEEAAKALKQAVKLNPDDTEYQTELGAILVKLAQYREAISPLKKAVELDPENSRAIDLLADAEAGRKRIDFVTDNRNANRSANANVDTDTDSNTAATPRPPSNVNAARPQPTRSPQAPPRPAAARTPN